MQRRFPDERLSVAGDPCSIINVGFDSSPERKFRCGTAPPAESRAEIHVTEIGPYARNDRIVILDSSSAALSYLQ